MGGAFDRVNLMPRYVLRDAQTVPPVGYCLICGQELYPCDGGEICLECLENLAFHRKEGSKIE